MDVHIGLTLKLNMSIIYVATLSTERSFVPRKNITFTNEHKRQNTKKYYYC